MAVSDETIKKFFGDVRVFCEDEATTEIYFEMCFNMLKDRKLKRASDALERIAR